ncbi:MAG: hypothetical protein KQI35_10075 [Bacteroidetes bacterium]|nr:hypothetical protein [Bacteroidota bacterium]
MAQLQDNDRFQELLKRLTLLENRVAQLESSPERSDAQLDNPEEPDNGLRFNFGGKADAGLESHFGEFGLAWLGNVVLFFGITFFVQYLQLQGFKLIAPVFGIVAVSGIFFLARYLKESNPYMAKIFQLNGYVLAFYVILKLHFFTPEPVIPHSNLALFILLLVPVIVMIEAIRIKHVTLAGLSFILITVCSILSDKTHVELTLASIIALGSVFLLYRYGWIRLIYLAVFLVYLINVLWMFNNPFMGHELVIIKEHYSGFIYIFISAAILSFIALIPERETQYTDNGIIGTILFNGIGFAFVVALFILAFFKDTYVALTGSVALYCLVYSIILQVRTHRKMIAALYALFGFVTLSVTIYGFYGFPRAYFLLAIQSLLVVSMAIWFRSRFIVMMNSLLFVVLLMVYLSTSPLMTSMNVSFSIVALATARILNWKKERLTIRTDYIRNFYLILAFFMVLFTLYHAVADQYITVSWAGAAMLYFVFSLLLHNVKYRYMALATMFSAAIYLFIVDLARIELAFRVIALLVLAVVSIGLSFYYAKKQKQKQNDVEPTS